MNNDKKSSSDEDEEKSNETTDPRDALNEAPPPNFFESFKND